MIFSINSKEFLKSLQFAGKAVNTNGITPIFECVLLEAKKSGTIVLTGSDSNTTICTASKMAEFDLDGLDSVKIAAPYDLLAKTLSSLPNAPVQFTYIQEGEYNNRIELMFETDMFVIPCEDPDVYFKVPVIKDAETIVMPGQRLKDGINTVVHAASDDDLRPAMKGVSLIFEAGKAEFCCTDGHLLAIYSFQHGQEIADKRVIIPAKAMAMVAEFIPDTESEVEIKIAQKFVRINLGDLVIYSSLIDDRFPDYSLAIPAETPHIAKIPAETIKTAIKRAAIYSDPKYLTLKMDFKGNLLNISTDYKEKNLKSNQDITIESDIESFVIGFNARKMTSALKNVHGDFEIGMVDFNRGALIKPERENDETITILLMPVMLMSEV